MKNNNLNRYIQGTNQRKAIKKKNISTYISSSQNNIHVTALKTVIRIKTNI